jgi:hypothetical protein
MIKDLKKAALGYVQWKQTQSHCRKPWRFPEDITVPRILIQDCWEPLQLEPQEQFELAEASNVQSTPLKKKSVSAATTPTTPTSNGSDMKVNSFSNSATNSPIAEKKKSIKKKFKFKFDKLGRD